MVLITLLSNIYQQLAPLVPPGLACCIASAFIVDKKYFGAFRAEFIGTILMIGLTFSPGKWIGADSLAIAWVAHAAGVVAADKIGGGQHVNPGVTVSMWALGKCSYTEAFVRIMGAMGGGLVAFPLFKLLADTLNLTPLGGPEFNPKDDEEVCYVLCLYCVFLIHIILCTVYSNTLTSLYLSTNILIY